MIQMRVLLVIVAPILLSVSAANPPWIDSLAADGYLITEGLWGYFDTDTCAKADTCYAINPITPYGLIYLPPHVNETNDGNYSNSCHTHNLCREVDGVTFAPAWRVAPGEAIVLVGRTPPESTYWSFAPSLYTRFNEPGFKPNPKNLMQRIVECDSVPEDSPGSRCEIFSAVNDPLNLQTVKVDDPTPFNASFAMVLSWDSEVEGEVSKALSDANAGPVNFLQYPGAVSKLGVTKGNEDEFITVMRVEDIKRQADSDAFYHNTPFQVFRISRPLDKPPAQENLHASFDGRMRTRWTGKKEAGTNASYDQLTDGLEQLKQVILQQNRRLLNYDVQDFTSFVNDSGYECLANGLKCQGDCRDTIYAKATLLVEETLCNMTHIPCKPARHAELTDKKSDAFYVMGVNHKMTNQSLYSSITLYNYPKLASGILEKSQGEQEWTMMDEDYKGSAVKFLPDHPAAPWLYVMKFARECSDDEAVLCVKVPFESSDPNITTLKLSDPLVFIERMYIHPGTKSGPAVSETILPILIHFVDRLAKRSWSEQTYHVLFQSMQAVYHISS